MGLECDMEESSQELLETTTPVRSGSTRRTVTLAVGILTMCAAVSLWHNPSIIAQVRGHLFIGLDEDDAAESASGCGDLPFVKITEVVSSNLGKKGPDHDAEEGIIYAATAHHTGADISNLQIHLHSVVVGEEDNEDKYDENYEPAFTHGTYVNGAFGKFAAINVKQGESVMLRVHAYDADKNEDIHLPHAAISFFDLDTGADNNHSVEHVRISGFKAYYLSNETEVVVAEGDNYTSFTATKEGTGADNPSDPTELTVEQKNRAVTIEFEDTAAFNFEVGASAGKTGRVFSFVFRPSLLCAKTRLADGTLVDAKGVGAVVVPVQGGDKSAAYKGFPSVVLVLGFLSAVQSCM